MEIFTFLEQLPWNQGFIIIGIFFVAFAICGLLLVRKLVNPKVLQANHEIARFVFTNLSVLYAVLLGFTVLNVQMRFEKLKEITQLEANYLGQLYADASVFSEEDKNNLHHALKLYAHSILSEEWSGMNDLGNPNPHTTNALKNVWNAYYAVHLSSPKEQTWYAESINKLNLLSGARYSRLLGSRESLGAEMWTLLFFGALVMVSFTWFFWLDSLIAQIFITAVLALSIGCLLFIIYSFDTVFSGKVSISPQALIEAYNSFG